MNRPRQHRLGTRKTRRTSAILACAELLESRRLLTALTIAQDEPTSVVWGMPGEAVSIGAAEKVLPLGEIATATIGLSQAMDITRRQGG